MENNDTAIAWDARNPTLGSVGTAYSRISQAAYPDGIGQLADGPSLRYLSNRIFADSAQNFFPKPALHNGLTTGASFSTTLLAYADLQTNISRYHY